METVMSAGWSLSIITSSTPTRVTSCGTFQFCGVKVSEVPTVASSVSLEARPRTTFSYGSAVRTTVKVSVVPFSLTTVEPSLSAMTNPATSSSRFVPSTVFAATASKASSELFGLIETAIS